MREAQEAATSLRSEADAVLATRTEEANTEAARIRVEAEAAVESFRADGERALEAARLDADRRAGRRRGRGRRGDRSRARNAVARWWMRHCWFGAACSKTWRANERRRGFRSSDCKPVANGSIESYAIVQRTLDEANEELRTSLSSAKLAADAAAWRAEAEPAQSVAELEREVELARAEGFGLEDVDDVVEVVDVEIVDVVDGRSDASEMVDGRDADELTDVVDELTDDDGSVDVDELFARIRASREEEVARAQDVLAADPAAERAR